MHEGDGYAADDVHQEEDADVIEANLAELVGTMGVSADDEEDEEEDEDDGDDTILEYCTDTDPNGNGVDDDDDDDNDDAADLQEFALLFLDVCLCCLLFDIQTSHEIDAYFITFANTEIV